MTEESDRREQWERKFIECGNPAEEDSRAHAIRDMHINEKVMELLRKFAVSETLHARSEPSRST